MQPASKSFPLPFRFLVLGIVTALAVGWAFGSADASASDEEPRFYWNRQGVTSNGGGPLSNGGGAFDVTTDEQGNVYVTGWFAGEARFEGVDLPDLVSSGSRDVFVAKYSPTGDFLWARKAGGSDFDQGMGIASVGSGGVVVTGSFEGKADFSGQTVSSTGGKDIFVARYGPSGNLDWIRAAGSSKSDEQGFGVDVSDEGIFVTGWFGNQAQFGQKSLTSAGKLDIFVARYSGSGQVETLERAGGPGLDLAEDIVAVTTSAGRTEIGITGSIEDTAQFENQSLTSAGRTDIVVAEYVFESSTNNFSLSWAERAGGPKGGEKGQGIDRPKGSANYFVTGSFRGQAQFGGTSVTSEGNNDIFTARYDPNGTLQWVNRAGGSGLDRGLRLDYDDRSDEVAVTGQFQGTATFEPSGISLTSAGSNDAFVVKYTPNGEIGEPVGEEDEELWTREWPKRYGGAGHDAGTAIALAEAAGASGTRSSIFLTGSFAADMEFPTFMWDPLSMSEGRALSNGSGSPNIYTAKISTVQKTLATSLNGNASGKVSSSPSTIDCPGGDCSAAFPRDIEVELTASEGSSVSTFKGWSGHPDCQDGGKKAQVRTDADKTCEATFKKSELSVTLSAQGSKGTVTGGASQPSQPSSGVDCSPTCTVSFRHGSSVTVDLTANWGSQSAVPAQWKGDCSAGSTPGTATATMDATQKSCQVTFNTVSVAAVEVTQVVQNEIFSVPVDGATRDISAGVPMLPKKPIAVRYYLFSNTSKRTVTVGPDKPKLPFNFVRTSGNSNQNFSRSPNTGQSTITVEPAPSTATGKSNLIREMRADPSRTLNYVYHSVPTQVKWLALNLGASGIEAMTESGTVRARKFRKSSTTMRLDFVPVDPPGGGSNAPSNNQIENNVVDYVDASYPTYLNGWRILRPAFNYDGDGLLNDLDNAYSGLTRGAGQGDFATLLGVTPNPGGAGKAECPGNTAWSGLNGNVAAQEIGHNLDLEHISSTHNTGGYGNEPTPHSHGVIGEFDLSSSPHETAPGKWGNVGMVIQRTGTGPWDVQPIPAGDPDSGNASDHVHEFMSYGNSPGGSLFGIRRFFNIQNANGAWLSDTIYLRLLNQAQGSVSSNCSSNDNSISRSLGAKAQTANEQLADALVFSVVRVESDEGTEYRELQLIQKQVPQSHLEREQDREGPFTLELVGESGEDLLSRSFALTKVPATPPGPPRQLANIAVPFVEGIERAVLRREGEVVAEREASPNPPEITLLKPEGDEVWQSGTHAISWEVSDADGDNVGVLIEYSPDGGESWQPLGLYDPGRLPEDNAIEIDAGQLPDSTDTGIIRVAATDGINTATDRATFSLEESGPEGSSSKNVNEDGTKDFGETGMDATFYGVTSAGSVTVRRYNDAPDGTSGIAESNVSSYRLTVEASSDLSFDSTRVRLAVGAFDGIGDPSKVTIYKRPSAGFGTFEELETTVGTNGTTGDVSDDTLFAVTNSFSEFVLASDSEPLPVELTGFDATLDERSVRLHWQAASGAEDTRFEVQRRVGQKSAWVRIGSVQGRTETRRRYQFVDRDLPYQATRIAYRLRQVDVDGSTRLSEPVTVKRRLKEVKLLGTYPNPARSRATIQYALPRTQDVMLRLYDMLGRQVRSIVSARQEGRHKTSLDVSGLPTGTYLLRLETGDEIRTQKLTIVR